MISLQEQLSTGAAAQQASLPWHIPKTHINPKQPGKLVLSGAGGSVYHLPKSLPTQPVLFAQSYTLSLAELIWNAVSFASRTEPGN